ncbi:MAG: PEP-CTERM sorting domain-containing protein [Chthoniobacterales bacterium]|nr:PEP-CTERM sorting domain-containing protein [Chthoniobacterales bacterium]
MQLVLGSEASGNLNYFFDSDSSQTATLHENVTITRGGSHNANLYFTGTGLWDVKATLGNIAAVGVNESTATATLSADNTAAFAGSVLVNNGTLRFSAANNFGTGASAIRLGQTTTSGVLEFVGSSNTVVSRQVVVGNGTGTSDAGGGTIANNGGGTLTFDNAAFNSVGTAAANRTLTLRGTNTGNNTISGVIANNNTGTVSVIKSDAGTLILSGSNTFSGGVNIDLGTLVAGHDSAFGTGTVNLRADTAGEVARLRSNGSDRVIGNAITFGGASAATANYLGGAGSGKLTFNGGVNWGSGEKTYTIDGSTVEFTGAWTGASTANINFIDGTDVATSLLILNGDRGTAAKEINIGNNLTVRANNANSFGSDNTEPLSILGGVRTSVVELENNITLARTLSVQGRDSANANVALRNRSGDNSLALDVGAGGTRYNIDAQAGTLTITNISGQTGTRDLFVTGAGNVVLPNWQSRRDLTMNGTGTLTMGGGTSQTSLSGVATVNSGTLDLNSTSAGAALAATGGLVINSNAMVVTRSSGNSIGTTTAVTVNAGGLLDVQKNNVIGALSGAGTILNTTATDYLLTVNNDNGSSTFTGLLGKASTGNLNLTKNGTGTFTLGGTNTHTLGTVTVSAGTLQLAGASVSVNNGAGYILNSGVYDLNGQTVAAGSYEASQLAAVGAKLMNSSSNTATIDGTGNKNTVWINADGAVIETVGDLAIGSIVTDGAGTRGFTKIGAGALVLLNDGNDYDTTTISAGTVQVGNGGSTGRLGLGAVTNNAALVFNRTGSATVANNISGSGTFTKQASGTITLTGTNSYTGTTTVSAGGLLVNGDMSGATNTLTVASGATLGGSGIIGGATTISGNLAPGNSPGLLTFTSDLTLSNTAVTTMEIVAGTSFVRGTDFDAIDVGGLLTYGGSLVFDLSGVPFGAGVYNFNLFDADSFGGDFDSVTLAGLYTGSLTNSFGTWSASYLSGSLTNNWTFTEADGVLALEVVPEPSTYALLAVAAAGLGAHVIRRRRR